MKYYDKWKVAKWKVEMKKIEMETESGAKGPAKGPIMGSRTPPPKEALL